MLTELREPYRSKRNVMLKKKELIDFFEEWNATVTAPNGYYNPGYYETEEEKNAAIDEAKKHFYFNPHDSILICEDIVSEVNNKDYIMRRVFRHPIVTYKGNGQYFQKFFEFHHYFHCYYQEDKKDGCLKLKNKGIGYKVVWYD